MSVSTKIRSALHALGLLALLAVAPGALAAPATLTFSSNAGLGDAIASDGDGGSLDIPGKDIQIINISDTAGTNRGAIHWRGPAFGIPSALTYDDFADGTTKGMAVRSGDGAEFRLVSFDYLNWGEQTPFTNTVVGYRDGAQVATMTFNGFNSSDFVQRTIALSDAFANVDDVRMFISEGGVNGDSGTWHSMNNIVIDDAVVPLPPVVSDARIAISGASGTGGAYKIGDTVTATWNNTASGDNNLGVTEVTFDFSAFGGGAAVVATNTAETWQASFTLTAGAIDAVNRNVRVTAINNVGPTTTADTTNATVDNVAPTVTAANIAISGASGTGGAYKIGDTVTATWNNTAGGDNNSDTISNVTVDFNGFGGGSAVVATNSSGTWTATYVLAAGGISADGRNVSVSATDNAGNLTTRADTANATVDNTLPAVVSIAPAGGASDTDTSVTFTAIFTETVTGLSVDDFSLTSTGSATGTIASVSGSGAAFNLVVNGITGAGTLRVDLNSGTDILDGAGNGPPAAFNAGSSHTVAIPLVPGAPDIGTATAGNGQASITFSAPADNGGAAITGYTVTSSPGAIVGSGTSSPLVVTGLTNGTAYTFTVTATNAVGTGAASAASNSITPKAEQAITFNNPGAQNFGTTPTLTATSDSGLPVSFSSSTTGVCTVTSGGTLTFLAAGSCTINADQGGDTGFLAAPQISRTFTVNAIVPGAPTAVSATAGDTEATLAFTAPASNGGSAVIGYTVTSSPSGFTATGAAGPITINGLTNGVSYTFTVTASNAAGTGDASVASNSITPASPQVITFNNPGTQNFSTTPTLTATSDSGLTPTFTSTTTGVCLVTSGGTLTFLAAGSCTINADQDGNASYLPAPQVSRTFTVNSVAPGAPTAITATAGDTQASVAFTAPAFTGGSAVTGYTVTSNPGGLTATGAAGPITVNGLTNGVSYTFTVVADNVAGTGSASAASNAITPAAGQAITFANPGAQDFGTTPTLVATADSGLPVTFTSSTTGVCTVTSGGVLTFVTAGTCTINADQAGDASNAPALQVSQSFAVNAVVPGEPTAITATAGDTQASISFSAPVSTGGSAVTGYTVVSSPGGLTATTVAGPVTVSGLTNGVSYTFAVTAENVAGAGSASVASNAITPTAGQTITFANPGAQDFGASPTLVATADSGLPVTFTSSTTGVCTITSGGVLTFVTAGLCSINADQPGDASNAPALRVSQSFAVDPVVPGAPVMGAASIDGPGAVAVTFTGPASTGGAAITNYTVTSSPGGLTATGVAGPITVNGLGNGISYTFTVTADNAAGTGSASVASNPVTLSADQTITFANPGAQDFGTSPTLVATADSGLPVTFTSSTTGVCTVTSGGVLTFVTPGTCTINADQTGDASNAPALRVSQSFAVNAVAPGAPGIGAASIAGPGAVAVTFTAPTFAGGAAITGYTVTSNPSGVSATGAGSPVTVTGLDPGTAYTFTVIATNAVGTGIASGATAPVTPVPALDVDPVAVTVAYGASASPVDLAITGTPTLVGIASAPQHGVAVVSGMTITYQPAAGYAGQDSFTYTASDAYTTTTPAVVTVTVAAPSVALDATAPPAATGGTTYTHALVASGGAAPYTFTLVGGRLPQGLALSANGALSGTPTESGDFAFTAAVVDSSTGTGPFTAQRAYALEVAAPVISLSLPATLDAIYGDTFEQTLDATGGTAPYTYTVIDGALPAGLVLSMSGRLSGAPSVAGRFDVTAQVRDANGFTASQGFELVVSQAVQSITGFATNPAAPVFAPDGTFALSAEGGASGLPLVFASTSPTVCTVEGAVVTMRAAGLCSLTADQAGDANFEAAPQVRLDVEIAAAVPTLVWPEQLNKILGEAAFALDDPDSPSAGTFAFSSSQREVASIDGRTVTLHGEGVAIITATQAAAGNYAAASIEMRLSVTTRPDPTRDPGVTGLLQAQVDASVRFAQAQQSNIRDRLRQVRSGVNASSSNVTLTYDGGVNGQGLSAPVGQAAASLWPAMPAGWGAWVSGTATVGGRGGASAYDFDTDGITIGADRALSDQVLIGVAGSLAHNNTELDAVGGSRMQADQRSLALYGLWRAGEHVFVDALAGAGRLEFDLRRWSSDAGALATGARKGDQWFASLAMGYEHRGPAMTLTSYGRVDTSRSTLDAYREYGLDLYDLAYRRQDVDSTTVALGVEGSYRIGGDTGRVRPFWTLEYREALENRNDAAMNYVILPQATDYSFAMRSYNDNALTLSGGLDVRLTGGWALSLLLGHEQASQSTQNSSIGLRLTYGTQPTGPRGSADAAGGRRRAAGCTNACDVTSGTTTTSAGGPHGE
ncbi:fibronectin type III domain-containing protein [Luteimonas terrae]|uniref:Uncharacterized protein YhjY with autotransporter beta-barrel domain n=1 Tax=Luteimonas terrae TaxID=1530191 RepID=A0ABU1XTZ1_9GAMM|nr:fibronectin type III domain-containing protein [Luteimonas terrae]MDR7191561.1 uncharacterized protein YhjY with autotransporter beta-barrel domain [Luteimonas terrae]